MRNEMHSCYLAYIDTLLSAYASWATTWVTVIPSYDRFNTTTGFASSLVAHHIFITLLKSCDSSLSAFNRKGEGVKNDESILLQFSLYNTHHL